MGNNIIAGYMTPTRERLRNFVLFGHLSPIFKASILEKMKESE
jgi:hypothetical protein